MTKVQLDEELVARIAETIEAYNEENNNEVLNRDVVLALRYVTACAERVAIPNGELH